MSEIPGSIQSGESAARGSYIAWGNLGAAVRGCNGSAPVPTGRRALIRAWIVTAGSSRALNWVRVVERTGEPPSEGGSVVAGSVAFRYAVMAVAAPRKFSCIAARAVVSVGKTSGGGRVFTAVCRIAGTLGS